MRLKKKALNKLRRNITLHNCFYPNCCFVTHTKGKGKAKELRRILRIRKVFAERGIL